MRSPEDELERRIVQYDREVQELQGQVKLLEEELALTRRKLDAAPRQIHALEKRLAETAAELETARENNERLASTLREAREQLIALKEEVEKLSQPPCSYGVFLEAFRGRSTADVFTQRTQDPRPPLARGRASRSPQRGQEVMLNEALNVIGCLEFEIQGEVVTLKEVLEDGKTRSRDRPHGRGAGGRAGRSAHWTRRSAAGDSLLLDPKSGHVLEKLPKPEVEELILEEVPDISLRGHRRTGRAARGDPRRGRASLPARRALPGARARATEGHPALRASGVREDARRQGGGQLAGQEGRRAKRARDRRRSYFLNIKGPELLNKYVGETERQIRLIFQRAKEKSDEGVPVIVFFDEMDSLFRTRGSGISSDIESTIVPQLLAEIDGVESLKNVIVVGASNREDLIDPAILRPGRLDVKIKIERPERRRRQGHLPQVPDDDASRSRRRDQEARHRREKAVEAIIDATVETDVLGRRTRTGSSRSPTRTATKRCCTSRTSRRER